MSYKWSPQQAEALDAVAAWHKAALAGDGPQVFYVAGYAGTGKTTLARYFAGQINGTTCYAAFTGKASLVMRRNGCKDASTIHSLIYQVEEDEDTGQTSFVWDRESAAADADLIVIDECSMVGEDIGEDLMRYKRPILVLGDPAQLPPVSSGGFFTERTPDVMLTEIHRQAEGSPIIRLATEVRMGGRIKLGTYGDTRVVKRGELSAKDVLAHDQILVGKNATRSGFNAKVRRLEGRDGWEPEAGDRLVCLQNDKEHGIFNGGLFEVYDNPDRIDENHFEFSVKSEDFRRRPPFEVKARRECFEGGLDELRKENWHSLRGTQQFDYGYALTVHKAQGSQWDSVVLYDESGVFREHSARWLYTGITRAAERLTVVI